MGRLGTRRARKCYLCYLASYAEGTISPDSAGAVCAGKGRSGSCQPDQDRRIPELESNGPRFLSDRRAWAAAGGIAGLQCGGGVGHAGDGEVGTGQREEREVRVRPWLDQSEILGQHERAAV